MKDCNQCGKCCKHYADGGLAASASDIQWWEVFRPEIFSYVRAGKIWISPDTGEQLQECPWLQKLPGQNKFVCSIYHDRPEDCRHYPVDLDQMVRDECEMLEVGDLTRPKQAQRELDELMVDSRPAVLR